MRQLPFLIFTLTLSSILWAACTPAPESNPAVAPGPETFIKADEAAVREVVGRIIAAYNRQDAKTYADSSAEDRENWEGNRKGRATLEKSLETIFARQKDLQYRFIEEIGLIFATPDVAIYKYRGERAGGLDGEGRPRPPREVLSASIMVKRNGRWLEGAYFSRPIAEK